MTNGELVCEVRCPRCGSTGSSIRPKGSVNTKILGKVRLFRCRKCGCRFRGKYARNISRFSVPPDLPEKYLEAGSLEKLAGALKRSEKTVYRWLVAQLRGHITWENFLPEFANRVKFSHIMGLDTTNLRIRRKTYYYLHVVDFPDNHLAFQILKHEDADSIKAVLSKIKALTGYMPVVVVMDRADELIKAVKDVYPTAIIQGCLFHLRRWLNKNLPTSELADQAKAGEWKSVKNLIMQAALSRRTEEKEGYIREIKCKLSSPSIDAKAKRVIKNFLRDAHYYHPLSELIIYGCKPEWRYNNVCERAMESVKGLSLRMHGFKSPELAEKYINVMWIMNVREKMKAKSSDTSEEKSSLTCPLPLTLFTYDNYVDLEEVAKAHNVKIDMLKKEIEKAGYLIAGDTAFAKDYVDIILQKVLKERPKTLNELMNFTNLDYHHSARLAEAVGLKLIYSSLDPQAIYIQYNNLVTNETEHTQATDITT